MERLAAPLVFSGSDSRNSSAACVRDLARPVAATKVEDTLAARYQQSAISHQLLKQDGKQRHRNFGIVIPAATEYYKYF